MKIIIENNNFIIKRNNKNDIIFDNLNDIINYRNLTKVEDNEYYKNSLNNNFNNYRYNIYMKDN